MAVKQPDFQEKTQNILERKRYSALAFCFAAFWLSAVIAIIASKIDLSSNAYLVLVGGTIQVCRLPIKVMKYLFENKTTTFINT
jgi:hypothetical protein